MQKLHNQLTFGARWAVSYTSCSFSQARCTSLRHSWAARGGKRGAPLRPPPSSSNLGVAPALPARVRDGTGSYSGPPSNYTVRRRARAVIFVALSSAQPRSAPLRTGIGRLRQPAVEAAANAAVDSAAAELQGGGRCGSGSGCAAARLRLGRLSNCSSGCKALSGNNTHDWYAHNTANITPRTRGSGKIHCPLPVYAVYAISSLDTAVYAKVAPNP